MRKTLVAAVALAPICLALAEAPARAQAPVDNVTNGLNTPIATATAVSGGPGDIDINSGGSVTVSGATPAVTQNSNNNVTNAGTITLKNDTSGTASTPATGVLLQGGYTGSLNNTGTITLTESYTATDSVNGDGIVEAPFAQGSYRDGVLLTGTLPLAGSISNAGSITIQGNNSFDIDLQAPVAGNVNNAGTLTLLGDNGVALRTQAVSGDVTILGGVTATGQGSTAINIQGPVGGNVTIYSSVTATGYSTVTRPTTDGELTNVEKTPTDVELSGPAVIIGGSVANGVFIGAPPVGTTTTSTGDLDGDGNADNVEPTGAVNIYGSAPGLLIGGTSDITLGPFSNNGLVDTEANVPGTGTTEPNDYDLIVRGSINSYGTYDGVTSTALQIGGLGGTVTMNEGVRVVGSINANSYDADAFSIHIESGATVGSIRNEGFIETTVNHSTLDVNGNSGSSPLSAGGVTGVPATAYGILVDPGATLSGITNYGYITASAIGDNDSAYAIVDQGGGVTRVVNEGIISASITAGLSGDSLAATDKLVALDLSANTTGTTLIQQVNPTPITLDVETTTSASGTTTTTSAPTGTVSGTTVTDGTITTNTSTTTVTTTAAGVTTTTTSTTPTTPEIIGDVYLGKGTNTVELLGGTMVGALDLGSGNNSVLTIDNTSGVSGALTTYEGALTYEGTGLALSVNNGTLFNTSSSTLHLSSLNVGATGTLYVAIGSPTTATLYDVTGTATLASGAKLGVDLNSPVPTATTYTVIQAGALVDNSSDQVLLSEVPYLVNATATSNAAAGTISINVVDKTAAQLGLNAGQSAALGPILASIGNDTAIQNELLGQYTRPGFVGVYNQLLPDYAGGVFQMASAASDAITRATSRSNDIENPSGTRGAWAQEFAFDVNRPDSGAPAYQGAGFGFVGGLETGGAGFGAFGVTGSFVAGDINAEHTPGENQQSISEGELGAYWQGQFGGFRADARIGGGYVYFSDRRELLEETSTDQITIDRSAKGSGQGWSGTGHFGAAYQFDFGRWFVRPNAQGDYFQLYEGSFTEHGGAGVTGDGYDLALASRMGRQASGLAAVTIGTSIGKGFVWRPEVQLGYRDVFSGTAGDTTAHFLGGDNFTLAPVPITGGGPVARVGVKADTDFYELDFQAGAEERNQFTEADVRLNVRVLF